MQQLMLFEHQPSVDELREQVAAIHQKTEKVRKGIYARHGELTKMYLEVKAELETLKVAMCRSSQA